MSDVWLVTGSSRGFGRELARAALAAGHRVAATARQPEQVKDLVDDFGDRVLPVRLDVADPDAARRAVAATVDAFGHLDVVANNAGYGNSAAIEDMEWDDFRAQFETNFFGVVNVTRAALPTLRRQRSGAFVQFSSVGGRVGGTPGMSAYQAAKFGVEGFSEVLAAETAPLGIKVVIVEPGAFRTDWQGSSMKLHSVSDDYMGTVGEIHRMRRSTDGTQPNDPARGARVIVDLIAEDRLPRRLLLGADAVQLARRADARRTAELEQWAGLSSSVGFPTSVEAGGDRA